METSRQDAQSQRRKENEGPRAPAQGGQSGEDKSRRFYIESVPEVAIF